MAALEAPLVGFRVWNVRCGRLQSLGSSEVWPGPDPLEARCAAMHGDPNDGWPAVPAPGCGCGLYAVDSTRTAERYVGLPADAGAGEWWRAMFLVALSAFCALVAAVLVWVTHAAFQPAPPIQHLFQTALALVVAPPGLLLLACGVGALLEEWRTRPQENGRVLGAVQLWGAPGRPVIVGELLEGAGLQYRAPYGRVVALASSRLARRIAPRLGVPVVPARYLELYAREFGEQLKGGR